LALREDSMRKILIVDDSLFMRKVLTEILSKGREAKAPTERYQIIEADSGTKALAQFAKENPDLVLLDIIMPEGEEEGTRILRKIMETNPKAKVVMITAVGQDSIIEECRRLGAKDYLVKPFDENKVTQTVKKYLK